MIPKFRAWDTMHNEWAVPFFIYSEGGLYTPDYGFNNKWLKDTNIYPIALQERFILMQSTGLLDKKGVEIFENDVIRVCDEANHKLKFIRGAFCIDFPKNGTPLLFYGENQLEVIGNIWENPELV